MAQKPLIEGIPSRPRAVRLVAPDAEALARVARAEGRSQSAVIREAVKRYLKQAGEAVSAA